MTFERVCGMSSVGSFKLASYPLVIAASANTTEDGATGLDLSWGKGGGEMPVCNSTTTPQPPAGNSTVFPPPPGNFCPCELQNFVMLFHGETVS